eukprot:jgi/Ulvmu1/8460/UM043_0040.1
MASPVASAHMSERLQSSQSHPASTASLNIANFPAFHRAPVGVSRDGTSMAPSIPSGIADSSEFQQFLSAQHVKSLPLDLQHPGAAAALMDHASALAARLAGGEWGAPPPGGTASGQGAAPAHGSRPTRVSDYAALAAVQHSHPQILRGPSQPQFGTARTPTAPDLPDGRLHDTVRRSAAIANVPMPKRRRTSHADMHADALGSAQQAGRPAGIPTPVAPAATTPAPPRAAIPGVVAPGPVLTRSASVQGSGTVASITSPWPVLPYLENVEYAIAHAESQPLTFHRTVSRPLADFLSAVMNFLGVQDASYTGLGAYLTRAFFSDHCAGRLCVYEGLVRYASASNWHGFLIAALEYIESAGFDTKTLFKITE